MDAQQVVLITSHFLLGAVLGSFLNVVALRYGTGRSVMGRSSCLSCGKYLRWFELVPLASYLLQRGRCRSCRSSFSPRYLGAEFVLGLLFVLVALQGFSSAYAVFALAAICLLFLIVLYDIDHKIIPDAFVYAFAVLAFAGMFIDFETLAVQWPRISQFAAGPAIAAPFFLIWLFSRGRWMGLGDAKIALGMGWLLGFAGAASAAALAFWIGGIMGILLIILSKLPRRGLFSRRRRLTMKSEVPFAPFLAIGTVAVLLWPFDILGISFLWPSLL